MFQFISCKFQLDPMTIPNTILNEKYYAAIWTHCSLCTAVRLLISSIESIYSLTQGRQDLNIEPFVIHGVMQLQQYFWECAQVGPFLKTTLANNNRCDCFFFSIIRGSKHQLLMYKQKRFYYVMRDNRIVTKYLRYFWTYYNSVHGLFIVRLLRPSVEMSCDDFLISSNYFMDAVWLYCVSKMFVYFVL